MSDINLSTEECDLVDCAAIGAVEMYDEDADETILVCVDHAWQMGDDEARESLETDGYVRPTETLIVGDSDV